jgi:ABC-type transport system substrate-binding protein
MLRSHRFTLVAVALALCAGAPASQAQDLRSPDAAEAGQPKTPAVQDYRAPDAVDPFAAAVAGDRSGQPIIGVAPARVRIVEVQSSGFGWGDAGIGAAGMLAIVMLGVGIAMGVAHHRRGRRFTATAR